MNVRKISRLALTALLVAVFVAPSMSGERRSSRRTELEKLAHELEQRLGRNAVRIERPAHDDPRRSGGRESASRVPTRSSFAGAIIDEMNIARARHGLPPLAPEPRMSSAASKRIDHMHELGYFDHVGPDGLQPFRWVDRAGYRYAEVGENLALGYGSAATVVDGWMRSPGHRANILGRFSDVGIAISDTAPVRGYRAPLVVALYARPALR